MDIASLKEALGDEKFAALQGYVNDLIGQRDTARNEIVRLRRDTISQTVQKGSVMPPGLVDHLTRAELRDLFRYLSELGKAKQ